jgi:hypothetical protein
MDDMKFNYGSHVGKQRKIYCLKEDHRSIMEKRGWKLTWGIPEDRGTERNQVNHIVEGHQSIL